MHRLITLLTLALVALAPPGAAEEFCVETREDLADALAKAQSNGQDDLVKIAIDNGFPYSGMPGGFAYSEAESDYGRSLTIRGGYSRLGCSAHVSQDPWDTILSGVSGTFPLLILEIGPNSRVDVENLALFRGYRGDSGCGAGLQVNLVPELAGQSLAGRVSVVGNWIEGNQAYLGGGLCIRGSRDVHVVNNVFFGNAAESFGAAMFLWDDDFYDSLSAGEIRVTNNTIVKNTSLRGSTAGIFVGGGHYARLANNLLWDNQGLDILLGLTSSLANYPVHDAYVLHNNYATIQYNVPPTYAAGNQAVAPAFEWNTLRLYASSPLVNAGVSSVYLTPLDIYAKPRVFGAAVDIGAAETQVSGSRTMR